MRYLFLLFLVAIAPMVGAQNRSNRIVGGGGGSVSTAASLVYDTVVTNATILDAEMDGLFTQYDRVNAYLTVNVSATLTEGIQLPGAAYVDASYLGKSLYVFAADSSATYQAYVSSADFGGIRLLDGSFSSVYYFQDGESVLFTLTQSNGEYKWVAENMEQGLQGVAAQIGDLQPNQTITVYQAAHGFTLPSYGFIPVYQDTSGKINQANLNALDSTHQYFIVDIPHVDTLVIQESGTLLVEGGHGLDLAAYYTGYAAPITTERDLYIDDLLVNVVNDSIMNLGIGIAIQKFRTARSGVDASLQVALDYATANSIAQPSTIVTEYLNDMIIDLKAAGAWDEFDLFYALAVDSEGFSKLNLKNPGTHTLTEFNAVNFVANQGWYPTGGGVTANYLETSWNPANHASNWQRDDASIGMWYHSLSGGTNGAVIGWNAASQGVYSRVRAGTSQWFGRMNDLGSGGATSGSLAGSGLFHQARSNSSDFSLYKNAALLGTASTASLAVSTFTANVPLLGPSTTIVSLGESILSVFWTGSALVAQKDDISSIISTYMAKVTAL